MTTWTQIWKNRDVSSADYSHESLLKLNGYDGAQSALTPKSISEANDLYAVHMRLHRGDSIYEIGCGAGAFLYHWNTIGYQVGGCDISKSLIGHAQKAIPKGFFSVNSATDFPVNRWDHVVSFGVNFYLDNEELTRMLDLAVMKAKYSISIFDIADADKASECENFRKNTIPDYEEKYTGLGHYYHSKSMILDYADRLGLRCQIYDQNIPGYENSKWRFNATILL